MPTPPATSSPSTPPSTRRARRRLDGSSRTWGKKYPSISSSWERARSEFVPLLGLPDAIRRVVCTTNANESLNARCRRAARACGHFPNETAALDEFDLLFGGRLTAGRVQADRPTEEPLRQPDAPHLIPDGPRTGLFCPGRKVVEFLQALGKYRNRDS
ncbi:transposase [Streptomyces kebangsaanensis]|uniref:Mutator family transposase n=1 Tax=Streptomyces kebangsaanensis TaxID=864058 RepID=A0ABW6KQA9_9ACTN